MGLDIYLYRYKNFKDSMKREKAYEKASEKNWDFGGKKYEDMTEEEKNTASAKNKEVAKKLGLGEYGSDDKGKTCIEINSKKYPKHLFKIGYLRSSYNDGGINSVLRNMGLGDLYYIFDYKDNDDYYFQPNWEKSKERVLEIIEKYKAKTEEIGNVRVSALHYNEFRGNPDDCEIDSEAKALEVYKKELEKEHASDGYSNINGEFYLKKPLKVKGLVSGVQKRMFVDQKLPCTYVVYEIGKDNWYIEALEITLEMIEFVLAKKDRNKYYLSWSG